MPEVERLECRKHHYGDVTMKFYPTAVCTVVMGLLLAYATAFAHHGDAGRYEETTTSLSGTVIALQLINPHSTIVVDVADENGGVLRWQAELTGASNLSRSGWNKDTLKPGDKITLSGRVVKSGAPYINLSERARIAMTETCEVIYQSRSLPEGLPACD